MRPKSVRGFLNVWNCSEVNIKIRIIFVPSNNRIQTKAISKMSDDKSKALLKIWFNAWRLKMVAALKKWLKVKRTLITQVDFVCFFVWMGSEIVEGAGCLFWTWKLLANFFFSMRMTFVSHSIHSYWHFNKSTYSFATTWTFTIWKNIDCRLVSLFDWLAE